MTAPRILVVEDDPVLSGMLVEILRGEGYEASAVPSAEAAGEEVGRGGFDLYLVDVALPGEDGLSFLARKDLVAKALVVSADDRHREAAARIGCDFLPKPFAPEALLDRLAARLPKPRAEASAAAAGADAPPAPPAAETPAAPPPPPARPGAPAVLLVDDDPAVREVASEALAAEGFAVRAVGTLAEAAQAVGEICPAAVVLDWRLPDGEGPELVAKMRRDRRLASIPVLLLSGKTTVEDRVAGLELGADDYLPKPYDIEELAARVAALVRRSEREGGRSPLTGLPGNARIRREVEDRLASGADFDAVYFDIDRFKPFNDRYGFARGDEAIRCLATVAEEALGEDDFLGHIGGDDFVALVAPGRGVAFARAVTEGFARASRALHDEEDRARGAFVSKNRKGEEETFPLLAATAAVVATRTRRPRNYAELGTIAAEVKSAARREGISVREEKRTG